MSLHRELSYADLFTLLNASLGLYAATLLAAGEPETALRAVLAAAVADGMDGLLARRGRSSSFGDNLDSLADAVTFCAVPALALSTGTTAGLIAGAAFLLAGLLRLARFNVEGMKDGYFDGLPSTGAGLLVTTALLVDLPGTASILLALAAAPLMLSTLPYWKPRGPRAVPLGAVLLLAAAAPTALRGLFPALLLALLALYGISGPVDRLGRGDDSP